MASGLNQRHWAAQQERGSRFFLRVTIWMVRYCPRWLVRIAVYVVATYFYLTSKAARRNAARYQRRLRACYGDGVLPQRAPVFQQFTTFAEAISDRFAAWQRKIAMEQLVFHCPSDIEQSMHHPIAGARGQILLCSHLGNVEITRALSAEWRDFRLNVLMHSRHAEDFNRALQQAGADDMRVIQVNELDAAMMLQLNQRIDDGEWLAIAADRIPVRGEKTVSASFLGDSALFAQGPWLLAGLLHVPVNTLFCLKENGYYHLYIERFRDELTWTRANRQNVIADVVADYATLLADYCAKAPLQWFNFYDFWLDEHEEK